MSKRFRRHVLKAYKDNRRVLRLIAGLEANQGAPEYATGTSFVLAESGDRGSDGRLLYFLDPKDSRKRLVIPTVQLQKEVLRMAHDEAAQQGLLRTYNGASSGFY